MRNTTLVLYLLLGSAGCDTLFPEFASMAQDLAGTDAIADMGSTMLTGKTCLLADLRAPESCVAPAGGRHVTIEETRASADVDSIGGFSISLDGVTAGATIAVVDGVGSAGTSAPTISYLSGALLASARAHGVALPVVSATALSDMALENGAANDSSHGALVAWAIDASGAPVPGVNATRMNGATGPLYDVSGSPTLLGASAAGSYGAIAFLDLPPGTDTLTITAPAAAPVDGDVFKLPVRGGAITVSALVLPAR